MTQTPDSLLDAAIQVLSETEPEIVITSFFRNTRAMAIKDDSLVISAPSEFERDMLRDKFTAKLSHILTDIGGKSMHPVFLSGMEAYEWKRKNTASAFSSYTFRNFIVGASNRFAHAAANAVAEAPFDLSTDRIYNPLFIHGPSGLGKTHLLYAIANRFMERYPGCSIVYIKSEDFLNDVVAGIKTGLYEFRHKYRSADLFLVDDVQFFGGKEFVQEEFFHTFNSLYEARKQIVVTADRPPKEIATLTERIQTRLEMGLLVDVKSPDLETRIALVDEKSRQLGVTLPINVREYIASAITNNVRELEGAVKKIAALKTIMGLDITLPVVKDAIADIIKERPGLHPTPQLILDNVSEFFRVPIDRILSTSREKDVVHARQVACLLMRDMANLPLLQIGRELNRDHTTIMNALKQIQDKMLNSPEVAAGIADLRKNIESK